jgi:predicted dehydrogenase
MSNNARTQNIRIGVAGAGVKSHAKHIRGFQAIAGVEVVGVANRSRDSGQCVATKRNFYTCPYADDAA